MGLNQLYFEIYNKTLNDMSGNRVAGQSNASDEDSLKRDSGKTLTHNPILFTAHFSYPRVYEMTKRFGKHYYYDYSYPNQ